MVRGAGRVSGAEIYNLYLAKGLKKYKDVKFVYLTDNKEFKERLTEIGIEARLIKTQVKEVGTKKDLLRSLSLLPFYISSFIKEIKQLEKDNKFDLVCLQSMTEKLFLTSILRLMKYKIVWIEHGPLFKTNRTKLIKFLYQLVSKSVNKIITVSKDTQDDLVKNNVNKNKVSTIYIGIDIQAKLNKTSRKTVMVIGFLGSVCEEKGIKEFIAIAKKIIQKNKNFKFLIIGDGPLLKWARNSVIDVKDHFIFKGYVKNVKKYLQMMDVFFFPTKHQEGLSIALLEAMSMGIPVIASNMGGNRELINKNTGHLFDPIKLNRMEDFLIKLAGNEIKRKIVGLNAKKYIEKKFNLSRNIEDFYKLFFEILK